MASACNYEIQVHRTPPCCGCLTGQTVPRYSTTEQHTAIHSRASLKSGVNGAKLGVQNRARASAASGRSMYVQYESR